MLSEMSDTLRKKREGGGGVFGLQGEKIWVGLGWFCGVGFGRLFDSGVKIYGDVDDGNDDFGGDEDDDCGE